ncbi:hypothetical protein SAMN06269185_1126 [Natronoarchaeum philippinense]|uniref:Lysylphosphatidylglycerol synthase TM region n=1 Tax=Natronoarchaeum philippinense TaxID=558529 RepID=A0A285NBL4_NATPI|nr:hypothetical protein SAMN06269185_1126 [Natronoarchaeum philippinense]
MAGAITQRRVTLAGTALVLVGLVLAVQAFDAGAVVDTLAGADRGLLALAVAVYAASWPLRGRRYADVLAAMEHRTDTYFLTLTVFASQTANLAIPARAGDAVRAQLVRARRDVPYATGFASLAVERAFDLVTVAALAAGSAVALVAVDGTTPWMLAGETAGGTRALRIGAVVGIGAVVAALVGVALARSDLRVGKTLRETAASQSILDRALDAGGRFLDAVAVVARRPRSMAAIGVWSALLWAADVATAVLVLAAVGVGADAGLLVVAGTLAVSVGNLAKVLPLSQGGIGLYEAAFTAILVGLTPIGAGVALAAAVADHALKNAVTLVGGAVAVVSLNVSLTDAAAADSTARSTPTDREPESAD